MFSRAGARAANTSARPMPRSGAAAPTRWSASRTAGSPPCTRTTAPTSTALWNAPARACRTTTPSSAWCCRTARMRWVRDRLFPVRDARDEAYRVARVTSDITRRKEMEGAAARGRRQQERIPGHAGARAAQSAVADPQRGRAAGRRAAPAPAERQARAREVITRQVDHLAHLVDDLLDVARISEGKIALRQEEVELQRRDRAGAGDRRPADRGARAPARSDPAGAARSG